MNTSQQFTPKYWVVHDTLSDDVFMQTADKSKQESIRKFLGLEPKLLWNFDEYYLPEDCNLDCSLVEINIV
jgi:hypothetical protein